MPEPRTAVLVTGAARGIGRAIAEEFATDDRHDEIVCFYLDGGVADVAASLDGVAVTWWTSASPKASERPSTPSRKRRTCAPS